MEINAVLCWLLLAVRQSHFILKGVLVCLAQEPEQRALVSTDTLLRTPCFFSSVYKYREGYCGAQMSKWWQLETRCI